MFGSDWPVSLLKAEYGEWLDIVKKLIDDLSKDENTIEPQRERFLRDCMKPIVQLKAYFGA